MLIVKAQTRKSVSEAEILCFKRSFPSLEQHKLQSLKVQVPTNYKPENERITSSSCSELLLRENFLGKEQL